MPRIAIRQTLLLLLIAVIGGVLFWNLRFFVPAILGAYTLYVLLRTPMFFLTERWNWPARGAVAVLLLGSIVVILIPLQWVFSMLQDRIITLFQHADQLFQNATQIIQRIENQYGITLLTVENTKSLTGWAMQQTQHLIGVTVNGLGIFIVLYFILWFMLMQGKSMEAAFFDWLPLKKENVEFVRKRLNEMVWSNALGIPLMGVVQGFVALPVYLLMGIEDPWFWFAITFFSGMLPIVGVALAYVPLSLLLLSNGLEWKALVIFSYGLVVVGSVDNIARMWVLKKIGHAHPLITLFGVIVGLKLFGFIGFVFGPILVSMFILLVNLYHKEFDQPSDQPS